LKHETAITVRFSETDALGHVNNVSYFIYLEQARVEFFKAVMGGSIPVGEWPCVVAQVGCQFKRQAYFDQRLIVRTGVSKLGNSSVSFIQRIEDAETGEVIAVGDSVIVFFDFVAQNSMVIPADVRQRLEGYQEPHVEKV
jgi:acyl-CoA thioester hydrolase